MLFTILVPVSEAARVAALQAQVAVAGSQRAHDCSEQAICLCVCACVGGDKHA